MYDFIAASISNSTPFLKAKRIYTPIWKIIMDSNLTHLRQYFGRS
jgi:hypothetical protein